MTVKDLAARLEVKPKDVLKKLIERRVMMTINTTLDSETATTIAREFGADVKMRTFEEEMVVIEAEEAKPDDLIVRAPVVTVMGARRPREDHPAGRHPGKRRSPRARPAASRSTSAPIR